ASGILRKQKIIKYWVCDTPHERLTILYIKILDLLKHLPKHAADRKYTEQITNEKLDMVKAEPRC
uniref:Uncharacterized protein n=1 Tax=Mus spicilegus TaxID=10103 RepID=A0A8C6HNA9_MUSSI